MNLFSHASGKEHLGKLRQILRVADGRIRAAFNQGDVVLDCHELKRLRHKSVAVRFGNKDDGSRSILLDLLP
jgi:hypothetical protein